MIATAYPLTWPKQFPRAKTRAASRAHPDKAGGSTEAMSDVNLAMDEARAELDL